MNAGNLKERSEKKKLALQNMEDILLYKAENTGGNRGHKNKTKQSSSI